MFDSAKKAKRYSAALAKPRSIFPDLLSLVHAKHGHLCVATTTAFENNHIHQVLIPTLGVFPIVSPMSLPPSKVASIFCCAEIENIPSCVTEPYTSRSELDLARKYIFPSYTSSK